MESLFHQAGGILVSNTFKLLTIFNVAYCSLSLHCAFVLRKKYSKNEYKMRCHDFSMSIDYKSHKNRDSCYAL